MQSQSGLPDYKSKNSISVESIPLLETQDWG